MSIDLNQIKTATDIGFTESCVNYSLIYPLNRENQPLLPFSSHLRTLGGWMEFVDTETLNRYYYRNELVLQVSEEAKSKEKGEVGFRI